MKKETILWQIIVVIFGLFLVFTLRTYLQDKIDLEAATKRANCIAINDEKGLNMVQSCTKINQDLD